MAIFYTDEDFMTINELKKNTVWPPDYSPLKQLIPYFRRLKPEVGLEIGTGRGESTVQILAGVPDLKKLYTIDPFKEYKNWNGLVEQKFQDQFKEVAMKNLEEFGDRVVWSEKLKSTKMKVDFIYWDAKPNKDSVYNDLTTYYPMLNEGGILAGCNYQLEPVRAGMDSFRDTSKVRQPIQRLDNFAWFMYK